MGLRRIVVSVALAGVAAFSAKAGAGQPAATPPPDDSFLEFLGKDDVDDAKLWDFFKRPPPKEDDQSDDDSTGGDQQS